MDNSLPLPACPPPWDAPNDIVPLLVVSGCFLLGGWLFRYWKKKREARKAEYKKSGS
jgi:hypothetical protein